MAKVEISLSLLGSQETVLSPGISVPRSIEARGLWPGDCLQIRTKGIKLRNRNQVDIEISLVSPG